MLTPNYFPVVYCDNLKWGKKYIKLQAEKRRQITRSKIIERKKEERRIAETASKAGIPIFFRGNRPSEDGRPFFFNLICFQLI